MSQPEAAEHDEIIAGLIAPGAPFELAPIVIDGVPCRIFAKAPQTLTEIYAQGARFAERVLAVSEGVETTYEEVLAQAAALADFLAHRYEVGPGARVALLMRNRPEWLIGFIAITSLGASAVLMSHRSSADEIAAALGDTGATLILADAQRAELLRRAGIDRPVILAGGGEAPGAVPFAEAVANWRGRTLAPAAIAPEMEAAIMFTSGTTARAKGAILTHRCMAAGVMNTQFSSARVGARLARRYGAEQMKAAQAEQFSTLLVFPLTHTSGCHSAFLANFLNGGKIVMQSKWDPVVAADLVERHRVKQFSGSPTMLWDLLRAGRKLDSLVSVGVGGQALAPNLMRAIQGAFPSAMLGCGYGSTEVNGAICSIAGDELLERPTASGFALPTVEFKIIDDDGAELPPGEVGEICARGAMGMKGYCNQPEATRAVLQDGWIRMGDLGRFDEDGFIHIVDRKKDIVISGGENISCTEVEHIAVEHEAIAEAAAVGLPDDRLGERLLLAVVRQPGHAIDEEAVKAHVAARLAIFKVPRAVLFIDALPRNQLGKLDRRRLRTQILAEHGELAK